QIPNPGQARQNFLLDAVSEISVLWIAAQILERQDCDRFVDLMPDGPSQKKKSGGSGHNDSSGDKQNEISSPMTSCCGRYLNSVFSNVVSPGEYERDRKPD